MIGRETEKMSLKMIWAIILAAGKSERMGTAKLLLPWKGKTIIETVIENALESSADKVLVVLGANAEKIKNKINEYRVKTVVNRNYPRGMLSSVQTAFQALPSDVRAAIIMLGDQPAASGSMINKLIKAYRDSGKRIVLPVYRRKRGHPVLIDMKYRDELMDLPEEIGLRDLIRRHPEDILEVPVRAQAILQDIDRPEDYLKEGRVSTFHSALIAPTPRRKKRVSNKWKVETRPH